MIFKILTKSNEVRWETRIREEGRGSKELRRRFKTKVAAENFIFSLKTKQHEVKSQGFQLQSFEGTTFKQEADYWWATHKNQLSPGYLCAVEGILNELLPKYGNLPPDRFHPGFLTLIRADLFSSGITPSTINRKMGVIMGILNFASDQGRIPFNPGAKFKQLKEVRDEIHCWEREEAASFLAFANKKYPFGTKNRWIYVVYLLALNAAPRAGEIWGLKPKDIIENGELIQIQRQFDIIKRSFRPTKGKENRRVPCNMELLKELNNLCGGYENDSHRTIFQASNGNPIGHDNFIHRMFKPDIKEWGGKAIRFHDLRHTAITLMISIGVDLKTVQEIAGHKDIKTTMNYVHLVAEKIKETARIFSVLPSSFEGPQDPNRSHLRLVRR